MPRCPARVNASATRANTSGFADAALVPRVTTTGASPAVRDGEHPEVEAQEQRATERHSPAGDVVGVLVERGRAEVRPRVHAAERLVGERRVELAGDHEGDVVAAASQLRGNGDVREDVTPVRHGVDDDAGDAPACQFTDP